MSALLQPEPQLRAMRWDDLDRVLAVERAAYDFPWTRGNFVDSLAAGYLAEMLVDHRLGLVGYIVAMAGVDEMHLLNLTVAPAQQRRGHARCLLDVLERRCRDQGLAHAVAGGACQQPARPADLRPARLCRSRPTPRLLPGRQVGARGRDRHEPGRGRRLTPWPGPTAKG